MTCTFAYYLKAVNADKWYQTRKVPIKRRRDRERENERTGKGRKKKIKSVRVCKTGNFSTAPYARPNDLIPQIHVTWTNGVLFVIWFVLCIESSVECWVFNVHYPFNHDLISESPLFGISHHTKAYYLIIFYVNFLFIMIP